MNREPIKIPHNEDCSWSSWILSRHRILQVRSKGNVHQSFIKALQRASHLIVMRSNYIAEQNEARRHEERHPTSLGELDDDSDDENDPRERQTEAIHKELA